MAEYICRVADTEDAEAMADLYRSSTLAGAPAARGLVERLMQTGNAFLVADDDPFLDGAVRFHEEEGIGWFDLLVSARPWAGAELVRAVERRFQDRGLRLSRAYAPESRALQEYFARLGYLPIGRRTTGTGESELLLERRLPLLTVREQRRSDAAAIGELTGEDPWIFEQGARPGWFVASDGDRVVGVTQVAETGKGLARIRVPVLAEGYSGRGLEVWMLDRAATYAETNGFHTAEIDADPALDHERKVLEERYWVREGSAWRRVFFTPKSADDDDWA